MEELQKWPALASYVTALSRLAEVEVIREEESGADPDRFCAASAWSVTLPQEGEKWVVCVNRPAAGLKPPWREPVLVSMLEAMKENLGGKKPLREWPQAVRTAWSLIITHPLRQMSLAEVANCVDLSAGYLGEQFERIIGSSFKRALRDERVAQVCGILETTSRRVSEIASNVGGLSLSQFNRCFVAATGMSPSEWRRQFARRREARPIVTPPPQAHTPQPSESPVN